ncbi:unnamed protein product [Lepeophtheirus salmonis]|uniref:(salmon louse) hypothetical protein n=1 Tax=Lepeophtheirus salmonis TaxID=72036 RepID=A0A7R8CD78_LEPSM|nr:unnamed protein product [Lepeophtheirus salmonis]CAF2778399.1 unnamed protein product [Lepeophtheirus salmonis]
MRNAEASIIFMIAKHLFLYEDDGWVPFSTNVYIFTWNSSEINVRPTNEKSSSTWIIILSTLIPISLILSALIGLYFYKKYFAIRLAKPISRQSSHMTDYDGYSVPIPIMDYSSELDRRLKSGTLTDEFQYINEYSSEVNALKTRTIGNDESNKNLNRFIDIIPFDDNVAFLFSTKDYIATQGPKRNTVIDFWNMIVEKNVCIIVCLTNVLEDNRIKCFQYWPEVGEMLNFDEITIHTLKERYNKSTQEVVVRDINVFHGTPDSDKKCHFVTQIHLTSWPDHGVPESTFPLLETCRIIRYSRKHLENEFIDPEYSSSPICVHCSAGVDDALMEIDVLSTVKHLREQRQKMVQSVAQYKLVYQAIKDFINMKYHTAVKKRVMKMKVIFCEVTAAIQTPTIIMSRIPEDDFLKSNSVFDRFQAAIIEDPTSDDELEGAKKVFKSQEMAESNSRSIREVVQDLFQESFYSLMEALSKALADLSARARFRRGTNERTMEDPQEEDTDYIFNSLSVGVGAFMDKQNCRRRLTCQATKVVKRNVPGLEMLVMLVDNVYTGVMG